MAESQTGMPGNGKLPGMIWGLAALAACFVIATGILLDTRNHLRKELAVTRVEMGALSRELGAERGWAEALSSPGVRTSSFTLTPSAEPALRGRATVDPRSGRTVLVFENAVPPAGRAYELWALHENTPVSLGVIHGDGSGRAVIRIGKIGAMGTLTAFAVSLELAAGEPVKEPTGPIVMIGSLED